MYKRALFVIFALLLTLNLTYSTQIDVNTYVYEDYTIFNYVIKLDDNFTKKEFILEKPNDGEVNYLVDKNGAVGYTVSGDRLKFVPYNVEENVFLVKIISQETSREIFYTDSFRTYIGFNTHVDTLEHNLVFKEEFGEIIDVFPRNYTRKDSGKYVWVMEDVVQEELFVANFNKLEGPSEPPNVLLFIVIGLGVLLTLFIILFSIIYIRYRKDERKKQKQSVKVKEDKKIEPPEFDQKEVEEIVEPQETLEDFIEKHLTENEKEVVLLIKDKEGISQYDILNYIPKLTKSNLSKIISKLHSRKVLKRIKVGKVNKIYLGEKFEKKGNKNL